MFDSKRLILIIIGLGCLLILSSCSTKTFGENDETSVFDLSNLQTATPVSIHLLGNLLSYEPVNNQPSIEIPYDASEDNLSDLSSTSVLPDGTGHVAYIRTNTFRGGNSWQIWISNQSNNQRIKVYQGKTQIQSVAVSADGSLVLASIYNPANSSFDVFTFSLNALTVRQLSFDGGDEINVSTDALAKLFVWETSLNNKQVSILCGYSGTTCNISVLRNQYSQVEPQISGNGQFLALVQKLPDGRNRVRYFDRLSQLYTNVYVSTNELSHPSVSDDGLNVLFKQDSRSLDGLERLRLKTVNTNTLTTERSFLDPQRLEHPQITASGEYLIYGSQTNTSYLLPITRNIVTNAQVVTHNSPFDFFGMTWQETLPTPVSGALDATFGVGGRMLTSFDNLSDGVFAMKLDSNDKIIVAGYSQQNDDYDIALARYNSDGSPDDSFGQFGKVVTDSNSNVESDIAYALALDAQGRILVAGESAGKISLFRYLNTGVLDTSFGQGGFISTGLGSVARAHALTLDTNGRILLAGEVQTNAGIDFVLLRYLEDGTIDTSFHSEPQVMALSGTPTNIPYAMALDSDGRILLAGYSTDSGFALARYTEDGFLDTSFGNQGLVITAIANYAHARSVALDNRGRIILAGYTYNGNDHDIALARYLSNGDLDTSFGSEGIVSSNLGFSYDEAHALSLDSSGRIVIGGLSASDFVTLRYKANGTLDWTFGLDGMSVTPITNSTGGAYAMSLDSNNNILLAGYAIHPETGPDFALVRLVP